VDASAFVFATDLADEGVDAVLGNLQERAGLTGVMPAFAYHAARDVFPHNPKRKIVLLDRGECFHRPDPSCYDGLRIRPRVSALAEEQDVLAETCAKAAGRGLQVHAWTVFLHLDRPGEHLECVTRNAYGDPYPADLCPANPDVRDYALALVRDVARYGVTSIAAEALHYQGLEHGYHHERYFIGLGPRARFLLGVCFCVHCLAAAARRGVDAARVQAAVRGELEAVFSGDKPVADEDELARDGLADVAGGELVRYLDAREETVAALAADAAEAASTHGTRLSFIELAGAVKGYATGRPGGDPAADGSWRLGVDLARLGEACPEVEVLGYTADVDRLRLDLDAYRRRLGDCSLALALRPSPPDCETPDNLAAKVRLAREAGVSRVDFYHYGFVRLQALDWIRAALAA
jgi:hypothetical protein